MEKKILSLFLYKNQLKFNEIEKELNIRSNKLAYHLKNLTKKRILEKDKEEYRLSKTSEYLIPYLSEKNPVLPVVLIAIEKHKKVFLYQREKRPFKGKLSLPGGRILVSESIKDCVKRIMKSKYNINASLIKINSISLEHLKKEKINSLLLIFVTARTKDKIDYSEINKNKKQIISSDLKLILNDLDKELKINEFVTRD